VFSHSLTLSPPSLSSPASRRHRELHRGHARSPPHHCLPNCIPSSALSPSIPSSSPCNELSTGRAALPTPSLQYLAEVLPRGCSLWLELFGHLFLSLVGALGPVWCWEAHRGVGLGPVATAGEVRRHVPRRAAMHAGELSPMASPFV
jgi:hypothetical protein